MLVEWNSCKAQWVITLWTCCQSARCTAWGRHINKHYSCFLSLLCLCWHCTLLFLTRWWTTVSAAASGFISRPVSVSPTSLTNQHSTAGMGSFPISWIQLLVSECDGPCRCVLLHLSSARVTVRSDSRGDRHFLPVSLDEQTGDVSAEPPPRCLRWMSCLPSRWRSPSHIYTAVSHGSRRRLWSPRERPEGGRRALQLASGQQAVTSRCEESFRSSLSSFIFRTTIRLERSPLVYSIITIDIKVWRLKIKWIKRQKGKNGKKKNCCYTTKVHQFWVNI